MQDEVPDRVGSLNRVLVRLEHLEMGWIELLDKGMREVVGPQHIFTASSAEVVPVENQSRTSLAYPLDIPSMLCAISLADVPISMFGESVVESSLLV